MDKIKVFVISFIAWIPGYNEVIDRLLLWESPEIIIFLSEELEDIVLYNNQAKIMVIRFQDAAVRNKVIEKISNKTFWPRDLKPSYPKLESVASFSPGSKDPKKIFAMLRGIFTGGVEIVDLRNKEDIRKRCAEVKLPEVPTPNYFLL